jgi:hypothetical protein
MEDVDKAFFERADAYISVANEQAQDVNRGKVSASAVQRLGERQRH